MFEECHPNPLFSSFKFDATCVRCDRSEKYSEDGYRCSTDCYKDFFIHKKCAEYQLTFSHPSHPQHPLLLIRDPQIFRHKSCSSCQAAMMFQMGYHCFSCNFTLDFICATDPPQRIIEQSEAHHHPLILMHPEADGSSCHVCGFDATGDYVCRECNLFFHRGCLHLSPDMINHTCHARHPLKLLVSDTPGVDCSLCGPCPGTKRLYRCSICEFGVCMDCARNPPHTVLDSPRTHEHELTLVPRHISFTCDACGENGDRSPYFCSQCNFMIHRDCIDLPKEINVNRHDHRLRHFHFPGLEDPNWVCGVCHQEIDCSCGAYSCRDCSDGYAVHARCATSEDVWDGKELKHVVEEIEDIEPFEKVTDGVIKHFGHEEHYLVLNTDGIARDESIRCKACIRPIDSDPFYECPEHDCDFILHETCANLPRKKRHMISPDRFTLIPGPVVDQYITCDACERPITGFRYEAKGFRYESNGFRFRRNVKTTLDVRCVLIFDPLYHKSHHHPLYFKRKNKEAFTLGIDWSRGDFMCRDEGCEFQLDYWRVVLPERARHKCDDHTLFLCYGPYGEETKESEHWCDIGEERTDLSKWFYSCEDCGTTLHIYCALGSFPYLAPATVFTSIKLFNFGPSSGRDYEKFETIPNNGISRPSCFHCERRCESSVILKTTDGTDSYICSSSCLNQWFKKM